MARAHLISQFLADAGLAAAFGRMRRHVYFFDDFLRTDSAVHWTMTNAAWRQGIANGVVRVYNAAAEAHVYFNGRECLSPGDAFVLWHRSALRVVGPSNTVAGIINATFTHWAFVGSRPTTSATQFIFRVRDAGGEENIILDGAGGTRSIARDTNFHDWYIVRLAGESVVRLYEGDPPTLAATSTRNPTAIGELRASEYGEIGYSGIDVDTIEFAGYRAVP